MKIISDIRLYKSDVENIDGNSLPSAFGDKKINAVVRRVVMKLREQNFSLGDFHHLYLNFTPCLPDGAIQPAKRSIDRYYPWYRYYDIGISTELFNNLESERCQKTILLLMRQTLVQFFAPDDCSKKIIKEAIEEAVMKGEEMLMRFKEKKSAKHRAVVYLRYLDNANYLPLLCVYDLQENEVLRETLSQTADLSPIGEIQLSSRRVTIKPRKNSFAKGLEAVSFDI